MQVVSQIKIFLHFLNMYTEIQIVLQEFHSLKEK